jgi:hypothetical protein
MAVVSPSPESLHSQAATAAELQVRLAAPNLLERISSKAIKADQIDEEMARRGIDVHQLTFREELAIP